MFGNKKTISMYDILHERKSKISNSSSNNNLLMNGKLCRQQTFVTYCMHFELNENNIEATTENMIEDPQTQQEPEPEQNAQLHSQEPTPRKESKSLCKAKCNQNCVVGNCPKYATSKAQIPEKKEPLCKKQCAETCIKSSCPTYAALQDEQPKNETNALCKAKLQECCVMSTCPTYASLSKQASLAQLHTATTPHCVSAPLNADIVITQSKYSMPRERIESLLCRHCMKKFMEALSTLEPETQAIIVAESPSAICAPRAVPAAAPSAAYDEPRQPMQTAMPSSCSEGDKWPKSYDVSTCSVCKSQQQLQRVNCNGGFGLGPLAPQYQMPTQMACEASYQPQMSLPCQQPQMSASSPQEQMCSHCKEQQLSSPCQQSQKSSPCQQPQVSAPCQQPQVSAPCQQSQMRSPCQEPTKSSPCQQPKTSSPCQQPTMSAFPQQTMLGAPCAKAQMKAGPNKLQMNVPCQQKHSQITAGYSQTPLQQPCCAATSYAVGNCTPAPSQTGVRGGHLESAAPTLFKTFNALNVCACANKPFQPYLKACSCSAKPYQEAKQCCQKEAKMRKEQSYGECGQESEIKHAASQSTLPDSVNSEYSMISKRSQKSKLQKRQQRSKCGTDAQEDMLYYVKPYMSTQLQFEEQKSTTLLYKEPEFSRKSSNGEVFYDCVSGCSYAPQNQQQLVSQNIKSVSLDNPQNFHEALLKLTETSQKLLKNFEKAIERKNEPSENGSMFIQIKHKYSSLKVQTTRGNNQKLELIPMVAFPADYPLYIKPARPRGKHNNRNKQVS